MADETINLTNYEIDLYLTILNDFLDNSGKFGYAIARNYRVFQSSIVEFYNIKLKIMEKYAKKVDDDYIIKPDDPNYFIAKKKIDEVGNISHKFNICKISMNDLPDTLTARNIIDLDWMIED